MSSNFDDMRLAVEAASGGKNTVLLDDKGMPSVMVRIPKMSTSQLLDLAPSGGNKIHPAFIVNDAVQDEVYISKYINIIKDGRAYSLPAQAPTVNVNFENAVKACRDKGYGWSLTPFALWSAIALWCRKNDFLPHGNNNYGSDISHAHETAVEVANENIPDAAGKRTTRTATGTGPQSWNHDNTPFGIADMNGNVWEWTAGLKLDCGVLLVIPNADCMRHNMDMSVNSDDWMLVDKDGNYHTQGGTNTLGLKWDTEKSNWCWTTDDIEGVIENKSCGFNKVTLGSTNAPATSGKEFLELMALAPYTDDSSYGGAHLWANNNETDRLPMRGGGWSHGANAGVFNLCLHYPRSHSGGGVGFRSAYYEIQ